MTSNTQAKAWEIFNNNKSKSNFPIWPNETMVKLVFGNYLERKIHINEGIRVLDVGCGFGNNLLPFLAKGCLCYGVEVTAPMATQTQQILQERGFLTQILEGNNRKIPFADNSFDLLLSVNTIHYETSLENIQNAFKEFKRVLTNTGRLVLMTVGPNHSIIKRAKLVQPHKYLIQDFDFRDGTHFFCFETSEYLKKFMNKTFIYVETGRVTELLMNYDLDFLIAVAEVQK